MIGSSLYPPLCFQHLCTQKGLIVGVRKREGLVLLGSGEDEKDSSLTRGAQMAVR